MLLFVNKYYKFTLSIIILIFIAQYAFVFWGVYENDDVAYMRLAHKLSTKNYLNIASQNHFEHRWLIIIFTSIFYKIFGVNDYSSSAFCFISCLACFIGISKFVGKQEKYLLIISAALFLFNRSVVFQSHRTLADAPLMMLITLSIFNYFNIEFNLTLNQLFRGLLNGLLIFLCVITKESVVILIPFWIWLLTNDLIKKRLLPFWFCFIISFSILSFAYLLFYKIQTGNWFFRLNVLFKNNVLNPCSYDVLPFNETFKRITIDLLDAFTQGNYLLLYIPAFCAFIYRKKILKDNPKIYFLSKVFMVLLLCSNFMSISYKTYMPLCPDARHFIFLIPIASVLSAYFLYEYCKNSFSFIWFPILFIVTSCRMYFIEDSISKYIYLPFVVIILIHFLLRQTQCKKFTSYVFIILFLIFYAIIPMHRFFKKPYPFYLPQKNYLLQLQQFKKPTIIICNNAETQDNCDYMLHFEPKNITTKTFIDTTIIDFSNNDVYYLSNANGNKNEARKIDECFKDILPIKNDNDVKLFKINNQQEVEMFNKIQSCIYIN